MEGLIVSEEPAELAVRIDAVSGGEGCFDVRAEGGVRSAGKGVDGGGGRPIVGSSPDDDVRIGCFAGAIWNVGIDERDALLPEETCSVYVRN